MSTNSKNVYQETRTYDPYALAERTVVPHASNLTQGRQAGMNAATLPTVNTRWYKSFYINGALVAQGQTTTQFFSIDNNGVQAVKAFGNYGGRVAVAMPSFNSVINSYPLSSDLISPYYGLDSNGITRTVYYDKYMGQIQILTSMSDWSLFSNYSLPPGLLGAAPEKDESLETGDDSADDSDYSDDSADPPASTRNAEDAEPPAENPGEELPPAPPTKDEDEPDPIQFTPLTCWIITETEIRAAKAGLDQFVTYLFNEWSNGFRGFTAVLFYNYIKYNFGDEVAKILEGGGSFRDKVINANLTDIGDLNSAKLEYTLSDATKVKQSIVDYKIRLELEALRKFLAEGVGQYHAKEYCVRMPNVYSYIDREGNSQFSYVPIEEGWEEEGSPLDDTMVIGDSFSNFLSNQNGTFGPIIGYNASLEYDRQAKKISDDDVTAMPLQPLSPSPEENDPDTPDEEETNKKGEAPIPPSQDNGGGSDGSNAPPEEEPIHGNDNSGADNDSGLSEERDLGKPTERTENSTGWYCPLNTEKLKGVDGALYLTSAGQ